jgi:hypothetical protein
LHGADHRQAEAPLGSASSSFRTDRMLLSAPQPPVRALLLRARYGREVCLTPRKVCGWNDRKKQKAAELQFESIVLLSVILSHLDRERRVRPGSRARACFGWAYRSVAHRKAKVAAKPKPLRTA